VSGPASLEQRLLVLAPVGRDAQLVEGIMRDQDIPCLACPNVEDLMVEVERGVAALLVAEEALADEDGRFSLIISRQPPWSDLPVLLLTRPGADSAAADRAVCTLGNVTLLERPVRIAALTSAARAALRARQRQYQTRAHLLEREIADRRKDEFLATLAHELRNPLAPICNAVTLMRMSAGGPEIWDMMDRQVNHMVRLVDDLMEVSRITRGAVELHRKPIDLASAIDVAIETSRPLVDQARHQLTVALPEQALHVEADPVRLAQVFSNLINNAVKYTDAGGRIAVSARRDGHSATVTVSDTGIGIPAEALPRVFDMFVQADSRDRRVAGGLGIGLTLARRLVEMHGGTLTASSPGRGRGSEFSVRLPLAGRAAAANTEDHAAPDPKIRGLPRVLIVDDNRDAADSLATLLHLLGAEVRVTNDGPDALATLDAFHPAAVFLDLGMPGMDGHEVARRIREREHAHDTVLVALTGWGQEKDRRATRATGFNHHLVKPADITALRSVLASLG